MTRGIEVFVAPDDSAWTRHEARARLMSWFRRTLSEELSKTGKFSIRFEVEVTADDG